MKFHFHCICAVLLSIAVNPVFGQQARSRINWMVPALDHRVFVDYNDQYHSIKNFDGEVLYAVDNTGEILFIQRDAIVIAHPVYHLRENARTPLNMKEWEEAGEAKVDVEWKYTVLRWLSTTMRRPVAENPVSEQFKYKQPDGTVISCQGWRTLRFPELYPGIELVLEFHHDRGLKYKYLVKAGADVSLIQCQIENEGYAQLDGAGNLFFLTPHGVAQDYAPVAWYAQNEQRIDAGYKLEGKNLSIELSAFDYNQHIVIDPWLITPGFVQSDKAYDVERNATTGDIYVFGGTPSHQIRKFDSSGNALWTYFTNDLQFLGYYGDIDLGPDGNLYYSDGCCSGSVYKLNESNQTIMWTNQGFGEPWRLEFSEAAGELLAAGYSGDNLLRINPSNGVSLGQANVAASDSWEMEEIRSLTVDQNGDIYSLHCSPYLNVQSSSNRISRATSTLNTTWWFSSGFLLTEDGAHYAHTSTTDYCSDYQCFHGINGIITSQDYVFSCDGSKLIKRLKSNGDIVAQTDVNNGGFEETSGLASDTCQYIYVGTHLGISQYDSDLNFLESFSTPNDVYDIINGVQGEMILCGLGFVASMNMDCGLVVALQPTHPLCNGACNGSITVSMFGGEEPYTILWSTGSTSPTISNLCAGTYSVTVTDASGASELKEITLVAPPAVSATSGTTSPQCYGQCNGSATVAGTGGTPGYTYSWNTTPPQNTALATGLCAGNYVCTVTDMHGCAYNHPVPLSQPAKLQIEVNVHTCTDDLANGYAVALPSGGTMPYTYNWFTAPPQLNDTASGLYTGSYSVHVLDAHGCLDSALAVIPICYDTLFIPNIFTPNQDGENNTFLIYNKGYTEFHAWIYNRWGELVYEWTNSQQGWTGKNDSGELYADGVYYYVFSARHYKGNMVERNGYFHLVSRRD